MADVSDVADTLVALIAGILYPSGTGQPSAVSNAVRVYQGWPDASQLDVDLHASPAVCHVSVWPMPTERNTTRFGRESKEATVNSATLTLSVAGQVVTVGGTAPAAGNPHNMVILANGEPYVFQADQTDTPSSIAAALAALIAVGIPGTSAAGPAITLPTSARLTAARVGVTGTAVREVRRQERLFQISVWADTPAHRSAIAGAIDPVLADTPRITLADDTIGRLIYVRSAVVDDLQKEGDYRRDLFYTVEYGTTLAEAATQVTQPQMTTSVAVSGVDTYTPVNTVTF